MTGWKKPSIDKTIIMRNNKKSSTKKSIINTIRTCTSPIKNYSRNNSTKSMKRSQKNKMIQTTINNNLKFYAR